jgi:integrase
MQQSNMPRRSHLRPIGDILLEQREQWRPASQPRTDLAETLTAVGRESLVPGAIAGFAGPAHEIGRQRANEKLEKAKEPPLPAKLTPHGLRHTFCSLLYAVGEDARTVMAELGHSDPALSLRVYAHSMRYGEREREQLRRLIEGAEWTGKDGNDASRAHATNSNQPAEPVESGAQGA